MTEYDFSSEAWERHLQKQEGIYKWVEETKQVPKRERRDPNTPATPAVNTHRLADDRKIHHRGQSHDQYRHPDRTRDRYGERDKERGVHGDTRSLQPTSRRPRTRRQQSVPPPLPLPPHLWQMPYLQNPSPMHQYPHEDALRSRSSHSSSTHLHSPKSYYPKSYVPPNSYFPPQPSPPKHSADRYHIPDVRVSLSSSYSQSNFHCHRQNLPQYGHSAYQDQIQPRPTLFKRLIRGLTGGNKQAAQRVPRRKRSSSF